MLIINYSYLGCACVTLTSEDNTGSILELIMMQTENVGAPNKMAFQLFHENLSL